MTRSRTPTLKQARQAALEGRVEEAVPLLRAYADRGDTSAAASLAELLAFQGEWRECLERAGAFIARPQSAYAGNVFDDMIRLLARAGSETHQWELLLHLIQTAEQRVEENIAEYNPPKQEAAWTRYRTIFQALRTYAQREGTPPHELICVFGAAKQSQAHQEVAYREAVQNATQLRPDLRRKPDALSAHHFSLAQFYNQEAEGIRLYEEERMPPDFDRAVFVAKAYVHRDQPERAWDVLWKYMSGWWPVDRAQVVPVVLLVDQDLATLMSHERCAQVLTLPRGPKAL